MPVQFEFYFVISIPVVNFRWYVFVIPASHSYQSDYTCRFLASKGINANTLKVEFV